MKRRQTIAFTALCLATLLIGCSGTTKPSAISSPVTTDDGAVSPEWSNVGSINFGSSITVSGAGIAVNGTTVTITKGGDFTVTGTASECQIHTNTDERVKLRLNGVDLSCTTGPVIFFENSKKSFITLTDGTQNKLTDGSNYTVDAKAALFSNDSLEIKGGGSLTVIGNFKHAIASDDDIVIENGNLTLGAVVDGLRANDNITITGGSLTIAATSDGMESEGDIIIGGGTIVIEDSEEGIEALTDITINGGSVSIVASDDGINAGESATLNGGTLDIDCNGDGLDSNGSMVINGGTVTVFSGDNANGPLDIGEGGNTFTINGGTVMATGGNMGIAVSEDSTQYSLWVGHALKADDKLTVTDSAGKALLETTLPKSASLTYLSSPDLKADTTYTVSVNGTSLGEVTTTDKAPTLGQMGGFGGPGGKR